MRWDFETYDRLVHQIYEAVVDPQLWDETLILLAETLNLGGAHLFLTNVDEEVPYLSFQPRTDPAKQALYLQEYAATDVRTERILGFPIGVVGDERLIISDEEKRKSAVHQELLIPHGWHEVLGINVGIDGTFGCLSVASQDAFTDFSQDHYKALSPLANHLVRAMRLLKVNKDLQLKSSRGYALSDFGSVAQFQMRRTSVEGCNQAARNLLSHRFLQVHQDRLACSDPIGNRRLQEFLSNAGNLSNGASLMLRDPEEGSDYFLKMHRPDRGLDRLGGMLPRVWFVLIRRQSILSGRQVQGMVEFCKVYDLSPTETRAICGVLALKTPTDIAMEHGLALNTVQKQLKAAMARMGFSSQKQVIMAFEAFASF